MFAVLIPAGPDPRELERLRDTLASLRCFEDGSQVHLILVDDCPTPRELPVRRDEWGSLQVLHGRVPDRFVRTRANSAMTLATLNGLRAAASLQPEFTLKLDTDALVIGPVAQNLCRAFADPELGLVGSYTHTCAGAPRDWSHLGPILEGAARPLMLLPGPRLTHVRFRRPSARHAVRSILDRAIANGYELGAHCLGGAYAVGPGLLRQPELLDWRPWIGTRVGEDAILGVLTFAAGLNIRGLVGPNEPFGLAWRGLPMAPDELLTNGYGIVHSVKDQEYGSERELREYFCERRLRHAFPAAS